MGNKSSQNDQSDEKNENDMIDSKHKQKKVHVPSLITLYEKLELTADGDNTHPGELSRVTFENAFHGPLHKFGKLMYTDMVKTDVPSFRERITREQFVKAGVEILKMYEKKQMVKYYFHLFASGKDFLTLDDAKQMFEVAFTLTLSLSKILHKEDERDLKVVHAMAAGLFGSETEVQFERFHRWLNKACPHMFHSVHNWVCNVMTGSTLPEEVEMARVPQLEGVVSGNKTVSMAILWLMSITLPSVYIKTELPPPVEQQATKPLTAVDPLLTALNLLKKIARLPQIHSWVKLYSSDDHGLSINRFQHHVASYNAPTVTLMTFEGKNLYCLALDTGWREGPSKFGGKDCMLIQIFPVFRVVQAGPKMVRWCETSRDIPAGISVGCEGMTEVLKIPKDFDSVFHYGASCTIYRFEVLGCGSDSAFESQKKQKKWEAAAVQREQSRKLRPYGENWKDSPDKQLLQWGGVDVGGSFDR